jgi:hypothetical protein
MKWPLHERYVSPGDRRQGTRRRRQKSKEIHSNLMGQSPGNRHLPVPNTLGVLACYFDIQFKFTL